MTSNIVGNTARTKGHNPPPVAAVRVKRTWKIWTFSEPTYKGRGSRLQARLVKKQTRNGFDNPDAAQYDGSVVGRSFRPPR